METTSPVVCRLATYNIHGGRGMDKVLDLPRIAAVIQNLHADLIAVNEIDSHCVRSDSQDQPRLLAELLGMNHCFIPALEMRAPRFPEQGGQTGWYGSACYSPYAVTAIRHFALPGLPEMEPRAAALIKVAAPREFYAIVTHFCWEPKYEEFRVASVAKINAEVRELHRSEPEMPVVLMGDLNAEPYSAPVEALRKDWDIAGEGGFQPTHPANRPREIIDYIMLTPRKAGRFVHTVIVPEPLASDHRPLLTELQFTA